MNPSHLQSQPRTPRSGDIQATAPSSPSPRRLVFATIAASEDAMAAGAEILLRFARELLWDRRPNGTVALQIPAADFQEWMEWVDNLTPVPSRIAAKDTHYPRPLHVDIDSAPRPDGVSAAAVKLADLVARLEGDGVDATPGCRIDLLLARGALADLERSLNGDGEP